MGRFRISACYITQMYFTKCTVYDNTRSPYLVSFDKALDSNSVGSKSDTQLDLRPFYLIFFLNGCNSDPSPRFGSHVKLWVPSAGYHSHNHPNKGGKKECPTGAPTSLLCCSFETEIQFHIASFSSPKCSTNSKNTKTAVKSLKCAQLKNILTTVKKIF
jgi:hypothetical protein